MSNENIIPNSLMKQIVEKIDETRDEYFNNMRFKPIDITFTVDKSIGIFSVVERYLEVSVCSPFGPAPDGLL